MNKRMAGKCVLFVAMILMLLLPLSSANAAAIHTKLYLRFGAGEYFRPEYPDMSSDWGNSYSLEDFEITYSCDSELLQVSEDGTLYFDPADWSAPRPEFDVIMQYTLISNPRRVKSYCITVYVFDEFKEIYTGADELNMGVGEKMNLSLSFPENVYLSYEILPHDENVASIALKASSSKKYFQIEALAEGKTELTIRLYNGIEKTVPITVGPAPTKISFAQDVFECVLGETVELAPTLDGYQQKKLNADDIPVYLAGHQSGRISEDNQSFTAICAGAHKITMTAYNGVVGSALVHVYSPANTVTIKPTLTTLNLDTSYHKSTMLYMYDENGEQIYAKLKVDQENNIVSLRGITLTALREGTVTVTATTPSGATDSVTISVYKRPKQMEANPPEMVLEIGQTAQVLPVFDQGWGDVEYSLRSMKSLNQSGRPVVRLDNEGNIEAVAPGTVEVYMQMDTLTASCYVTVPDSTKNIEIIRPEKEFGIHHSYQLSVRDGNGTVYPAVFAVTSGTNYASVAEDGLMIGLAEGTARISATLENGEVLYYDQFVSQIPLEISAPNVDLPINEEYYYMNKIHSDVGDLSWTEVNVEIANERIATYSAGKFTPLRMGATQVTLTSKLGNARTTFLLTVTAPSNALYPDKEIVFVAVKQSVQIPTVRDYYGNVVKVTYEIVEESIGIGNTSGSSFTLRNGKVTCTWPTGTCEVQCTSATGATCVIKFQGYPAATKMHFQRNSITLNIGETTYVSLECSDGSYGDYSIVKWQVENPSIIRFEEDHSGNGNPCITGLAPGTTTLKATLFNGTSATCTINVTEQEQQPNAPLGMKVYTANNTLLILGGYSLQFYVDVVSTWDNTQVNWSVDNPALGSITEEGLFTAAHPKYDSEVTIIATSAVAPNVKAYYTLMVKGTNDRRPGDANEDGVVNSADAMIILQYGSGENVTINTVNADVNGDGSANIHDALLLMQYEAGWNVNLQ